MPLVIQVVVTGLAAGAVYGLVATGYALVYRLTGVVHLALGELVGLAAFATLVVAGGAGPVTAAGLVPGRFVLGVAAGVVVAVATGALTYLVVRPFLRRGRELGWIAAVVALAFAVRGILQASFARESYVFPDPFPFHRLGRAGVLDLGGGASVPVRTFFVIAVGLLLAGAASWLLERSRVGIALRAVADDPLAARALGIPVSGLRLFAFTLAGALAAVAVVAAAPGGPFSAETGGLLGLKGLVAALLAGFGSPWRALAAGLVVGVLETAVAAAPIPLLGPELRDVAPLALALVLVALRRRTVAPELS